MCCNISNQGVFANNHLFSFDASNSPIMQTAKLNVRRLIQAFNDPTIRVDDTIQSLKQRRMEIAKLLVENVGENANIEAPFFCGWGFNISIGAGTYINREFVHVTLLDGSNTPANFFPHSVSVYDNGKVTIGNGVRIGPGVCLCTDTHEVDPDVRREMGGSFALPIKIGDECWIGANATILPGVTIGMGSTVAAGAVVAEDVPEFSLVGGVPAKFIKTV